MARKVKLWQKVGDARRIVRVGGGGGVVVQSPFGGCGDDYDDDDGDVCVVVVVVVGVVVVVFVVLQVGERSDGSSGFLLKAGSGDQDVSRRHATLQWAGKLGWDQKYSRRHGQAAYLFGHSDARGGLS